jgi:hypothetical protein
MQTKVNDLLQNGWTLAITLGIRVLEASALWIVGRWLMKLQIESLETREGGLEL